MTSRAQSGEQSSVASSSHQVSTRHTPLEQQVHSSFEHEFSPLSGTPSKKKKTKKKTHPMDAITSYAWELMTIYAAMHSREDYTTESLVSIAVRHV
jgi:hypothetical protein